MGATLFRNAQVWDGLSDEPYPGEVLVEGNRIKAVAAGSEQIAAEAASETIDAQGLFLMPGLVEGHCHLSFVGVGQNKELGEIPVEEHLLRTCRNATLLLEITASRVPTRPPRPSCGWMSSSRTKSRTAISPARAIVPRGRKSP